MREHQGCGQHLLPKEHDMLVKLCAGVMSRRSDINSSATTAHIG